MHLMLGPSMRMKHLLTLAALLATGCPVVFAQTAVTWTSTSDTTFSNGANWSGSTAPANDATAAGNIATFSTAGLANPVLTASQSVAGVSFTAAGYTLSSSNGAVLTWGSSRIVASAASGTTTISAPLGGAAVSRTQPPAPSS